MSIDLGGTAADAWALWRRDRAVLLPVAGLFLFVPTLALLLLVDPLVLTTRATPNPSTAEAEMLLAQYRAWIAANGGYFVVASIVSAYGAASVFGYYFDRSATTLRDVLIGALAILPRYLLASVIGTLMVMVGLAVLVLPGLYLAGRLILLGPLIVAEAPVSAIEAIVRTLQVTRRHGWVLAGVMIIAFAANAVLPAPFQNIDAMLRGMRAANPVVITVIDAMAAAVAAAVALALLLFKVALYRRLG